MKKLIMIFAVLASVSFGAENTKTTKSNKTTKTTKTMSKTFVDALMPSKTVVSTGGEAHPVIVEVPMDVVSAVVTAAYGAK